MAASGSAIEKQLEKAFDAYTAARKISLVHLAGQFVEPGSKAADQKHADSEKPSLTRTEAFSRLYCRLDNVENDAEFKSFIDAIVAKKNQATSYEKVVVGLAHQFGSWGVPRNLVTAQIYFREAIEADNSNSYAEILFARMNFLLAGNNDKAKERSITDYYIAIDGSKEAAGLASAFLGLQLHHVPESAYPHYDRAIKLKFAAASRYIALCYNSQKNAAPRDKLYETALAHGDMQALVFYFLDQSATAKDYFALEAAVHGNYLAAFYAATLEKQNPILAANYYRWSLALRPSWDINFRTDVHKHFAPLIKAAVNDVLYQYGMAFNEFSYLNDLLARAPEVFVRLWKNDYYSDRSSVMKQQAIDFLLALNPAELPAATNLLLAEATKNCSEANIKTNTAGFRQAAGVAGLDVNVPPGALAAHSAIKNAPKPSPVMPKPIMPTQKNKLKEYRKNASTQK